MEFNYGGNSSKSGIYRILNKLNSRAYFGSAKRFKERWPAHASSLKRGVHPNKFLQADFNKCGADVFVFDILEIVDGTKEERLLIEDTYLVKYYDKGVLCYNLSPNATSPDGSFPKDPEKTRLLRSLAAKKKWSDPEYRKKASKPPSKKGTRWSPERYQKQSLTISKRKEERLLMEKEGVFLERWHHTEETKEKMSKAHVGKKMSEEHKKKLREANLKSGNVPPSHKGEKMCEKHKKNISTTHKARGIKPPSVLGRKHSEETKKKMSEAKKKLARSTISPKAKWWSFVAPDKTMITICSLKKFCEENSLSPSSMANVFYGKQLAYKGYTKVPISV